MGLALDEPSKDDVRVEKDGITFLVGRDLVRWFQAGMSFDVDWSPFWRSFSVRADTMDACC
jgi:hypothetical protein